MSAAEKLPNLYSEAEAAKYLDVHELTVARWRKAGKIACIFVGKSPRYTDQHLTDYLKANECPVSNSAPIPSSAERVRRTGNASGETSEGSNNALALAHQILSRRKKP